MGRPCASRRPPADRAGTLLVLLGCLGVLGGPGARAQERITLHEGGVRFVAFTPDGKTLLTDHAGGLRIWDLAAPKRPGMLSGNTGSVTTALLAADGRTLI